MKINQDMQAQAVKRVRPEAKSNQSFQAIVQSQTHELKQQEIQQLMQDITAQGDKLARFRSFPDLVKFKRLIKGFLEETVYHGLSLKNRQNFSPDGHSHELTIVSEIDEKLVELTDDIMSQEKKTVDLLGLIGDIKGLLINLYS